MEEKARFKKVAELLEQNAKAGGLAILEIEGRFIYCLVTKRESRGKPTYDTIWSSLQKMRTHIQENNVKKLAIPRIGCGLDKLDWNTVKQMIEFLFKNEDIDILVCNHVPTFIEYKSKVKAKSRVLQNKLKGTGGGPGEAQLNETENLCLNLIGRVCTEGDPEIEEIGLCHEGASTSADCSLFTVVDSNSLTNNANAMRFEDVANAELIDMDMAKSDTSSTPMIKLRKEVNTPRSRKNCKTSPPTPKVSALKELADTNERICQSLDSISNAMSEMAKANDEIASSNTYLAASINSLAYAIQLWSERK